MSTWKKYKETFEESSLEEIYKNHIILSGATGIDKVTHETFMKDRKNQISIVAAKAVSGNYKFTKYRLILISKGRRKAPREISIPTIRDRILLRGMCDFLNEIFKGNLNFELPQNVIKSVKKSLDTNRYTAFIKLDVQSFYPNINHKILHDRLNLKIKRKEILNVIQSSISTPTVEKASEVVEKNTKGVPQGLSISNVLAAIYLSDLDKKLDSEEFAYYRYVDDILILCEKERANDYIAEIISDFESIGLKIHKPTKNGDKSSTGEIGQEEFTYLGYKFLPELVTVRESSLDRLRDSLTSIFTAYKYSKKHDEDFLLWRLNLRITGCIFENKRKGWLFFFSEITDLDLLHRLDHFVNLLCRRFGVEIRQKSFVRAFYQIKHRIYETKYIPNFDNYEIEDIKKVLEKYFGFKHGDLDSMAHGRIRYHFLKKISKQVKDLDTDLKDFGY